jgi:hypothetical protein
MAHDGAANKDAIGMLERAVDLIRIMRRHGKRWDGVITSMRFIRAAGRPGISARMRRTSGRSALEPGRVSAAGLLAANEVETGNLDKAYEDARALVLKRPDMRRALFTGICIALCRPAG